MVRERITSWAWLGVVGLAWAGLAGCGPGSPGGPTMNNKVNRQDPVEDPAIQSNDVLAREARTERAMVKHILVGWRELEREGQDPRAAARTRAEADRLAEGLLARVRAGEAIEPLMAEHSEDPGSSASGEGYEVTPDAQLVFMFKRLSLRLDVGEAGLVLTEYGWHVIKRVE
jgi:peptidyl-prolyl cis-trans isomerase D